MEMANKILDVSRPVGPAVNRYYRPELDCLRFFAFFAVFTFHSPGGDAAYFSARHIPLAALVASVTSAGRFGVDLFFLLSAYLITELLLREQNLFGRLDLRSFYVRRILRIWPLYFLDC
jgi:peptidoglycan/LPS O-acetylase OafA/YrhL